MQSQIYPWSRKNLTTGKVESMGVQGALRPIELWEYVFPEESLADVLTALGLVNDTPDGASVFPSLRLKMKILRKMIGAKEIPKITPIQNRFIAREGIAIHPIGIREDEKKEMSFPDGSKYFQEAL